MQNQHTSKDGVTKFISQLETEHLKSIILGHLNTIKQGMEMLSDTNIANSLDLLIAGIDNESIKELGKKMVNKSYEYLGAYLIEYCIRGMDLAKEFQEVFGRSDKTMDLEVFKNTLSNRFMRNGEVMFSLEDWNGDED